MNKPSRKEVKMRGITAMGIDEIFTKKTNNFKCGIIGMERHSPWGAYPHHHHPCRVHTGRVSNAWHPPSISESLLKLWYNMSVAL